MTLLNVGRHPVVNPYFFWVWYVLHFEPFSPQKRPQQQRTCATSPSSERTCPGAHLPVECALPQPASSVVSPRQRAEPRPVSASTWGHVPSSSRPLPLDPFDALGEIHGLGSALNNRCMCACATRSMVVSAVSPPRPHNGINVSDTLHPHINSRNQMSPHVPTPSASQSRVRPSQLQPKPSIQVSQVANTSVTSCSAILNHFAEIQRKTGPHRVWRLRSNDSEPTKASTARSTENSGQTSKVSATNPFAPGFFLDCSLVSTCNNNPQEMPIPCRATEK